MNLFDIFLKNSNSNETTFSSIYNYLLDPSETHGMKCLFLQRILEALPIDIKVLDGINKDSINDFNFVIEPEISLLGVDKKFGKIDSFFTIKNEDSSFIIATEIKIIDKSASDETQLIRYFKALAKMKDKDKKMIPFIFIFLVPSLISTNCIEKFKQLFKEDNTAIDKCFLMFWKGDKSTNNTIKDYEKNVLKKTFEEIIFEILQDENSGFIEPISTEIKYVLRSLKMIIRRDFNRSIRNSTPKFSDKSEFIKNIGNHAIIYERLETIINDSIGIKLNVMTYHTSVGVPFSTPKKIANNSLFRILTCVDYFKGEPAKNLIIELNKNIYIDNIEEIKKILSSYAEVDKTINNNRHPNEKSNEEVIFFKFKELSEDKVNELKSNIVLDELYNKCKDIFGKYYKQAL